MLHVSHWIFATLLRIATESSSKNMVTEKMVLGRQVSENGAWEAGECTGHRSCSGSAAQCQRWVKPRPYTAPNHSPAVGLCGGCRSYPTAPR